MDQPPRRRPKPAEVARWMLAQVERRKSLAESDAADFIRLVFRCDFVVDRPGGRLSVRDDVLSCFERYHRGFVVWDEQGRIWYRSDASGPSAASRNGGRP